MPVARSATGVGDGVGVAVGSGVGEGVGVAVGSGVGVGVLVRIIGRGVPVGCGSAVGADVRDDRRRRILNHRFRRFDNRLLGRFVPKVFIAVISVVVAIARPSGSLV